MQKTVLMIGTLVAMLAVFYFLIIRPQKKREKAAKDMRAGLAVGDDIMTIGGIFGKVMKVRGNVITIKVGKNNTKMDIMDWGISQVLRSVVDKDKDEEEESRPKRMKKKDDEDAAGEEQEEHVRPKRLKKKDDDEEN